MSRISPNLNSIIDDMVRGAVYDLWTALPATVESYSATTRTINAQPLIRRRKIGPDGSFSAERLAALTHVPVVFFGGAGGGLTSPVKVGDFVLVVFVSGSIDQLVATGREQDAVDDRRNSYSDCFALTGLSLPATTSAASEDAVVLSGDEVRLGTSSASQKVVKGDALKSALDTLITSISGAVSLIAGSGAAVTAINTALGVFDTASTGFNVGSVPFLSTIVKVD